MEADTNKQETSADVRLLEAAIDIFGRHGYEAATTRMITAQAKVNISAIPYYFGGKEGLYRAVISRIVATVQEITGNFAQDTASQDFDTETGPDLARASLENFLGTMINFLVGSSQGQRISRIILREQMYPSSAYDLVFSGFMEPAILAVAKLVSVITKETSTEQTKLRAMAIVGQVIIFRVARETVVRALDFEGYTESELQKIREVVIRHTRAVLDD